MRIKTQLIITFFLFGFVLAAISLSAIVTNREAEEANRQGRIAAGIAEGTNELGYLAIDYMVYREPQQLERWHSRFDSFSAEVAALRAGGPEHQALARNIQVNTRRLKDVFESVLTSAQPLSQAQGEPVSPASLQVAWSRLAVQSQGLVSDASRLSQLSESRADRLQRTNTVVVIALVGVFAAYFAVNFSPIQLRALKGFARLQAGAAVIGSGNLRFTIEERGKDEIGDLARAFNRMTVDLRTVTASKADLEREMAERSRAQEALRNSEEKYRNLFTTMAEGFGLHEIILDAGGKPCDYIFLDANDALLRQIGVSREEVVGKRIREVVPAVEPYWIDAYGRVALTGEPTYFERYGTNLGKWFGCYAYSPARNQFAVLYTDITQRVKAEETTRQRTAELEAANLELEAFSYSVSHDLRAPLRSMEGFSNALLEDYSDKLDDQGRQYLKYVQESSDLMGR